MVVEAVVAVVAVATTTTLEAFLQGPRCATRTPAETEFEVTSTSNSNDNDNDDDNDDDDNKDGTENDQSCELKILSFTHYCGNGKNL